MYRDHEDVLCPWHAPQQAKVALTLLLRVGWTGAAAKAPTRPFFLHPVNVNFSMRSLKSCSSTDRITDNAFDASLSHNSYPKEARHKSKFHAPTDKGYEKSACNPTKAIPDVPSCQSPCNASDQILCNLCS